MKRLLVSVASLAALALTLATPAFAPHITAYKSRAAGTSTMGFDVSLGIVVVAGLLTVALLVMLAARTER